MLEIKNNKGKVEEMNLEVKGGKIGRTQQNKYVGDMYDEKGSNMSKIFLSGSLIQIECCQKRKILVHQ